MYQNPIKKYQNPRRYLQYIILKQSKQKYAAAFSLPRLAARKRAWKCGFVAEDVKNVRFADNTAFLSVGHSRFKRFMGRNFSIWGAFLTTAWGYCPKPRAV